MSPAKILQIIPELKTGGAEKSVVEMTEAVIGAGGVAYVVTEGGAMLDEIRALGGNVVLMGVGTKNPFKIWLNSRRIAKLIKSRGIDLVHARSRAPAWSGFWAARAMGVPFVTTYHGAYNQKSALKGFYNGVMARGDWVIANSHYTASLIRARHPIVPDRLRVIYRGVDVDAMDPAKISDQRVIALRKAWGLANAEGKKIVLQAARLTGWKGQRDVIEAAARLKALGDERAVFILAGDAQGREAYKEELLALIGANGLEEMVRLVGHVDDMAAAYKLADIVVVASCEAEAFGRTAAEAQAMGRPVIATDIGAPPEFLNLGNQGSLATAWLVPVASGDAIAAQLGCFFDMKPSTIAEMETISRDYIADKFALARMKAQTIEIYEDLLGGPLATVDR